MNPKQPALLAPLLPKPPSHKLPVLFLLSLKIIKRDGYTMFDQRTFAFTAVQSPQYYCASSGSDPPSQAIFEDARFELPDNVDVDTESRSLPLQAKILKREALSQQPFYKGLLKYIPKQHYITTHGHHHHQPSSS